jgi:hypothetical protein
MLVTGLVANFTLDMWAPCIQEGASCIFNFFIHKISFFLLVMKLLSLLLRSGVQSSLLKLLHHIATVILRSLHLSLPLQLIHFKFKSLDFSLQVIILLPYCFITRFYKHLLNLGWLAFITKSIRIKVITLLTTFAYRSFGSFGVT